jgi:hypothetical protein
MKEYKTKKMWVKKVFFKDGSVVKADPIDNWVRSGDFEYTLEGLNDEKSQFAGNMCRVINKNEIKYIDWEEQVHSVPDENLDRSKFIMHGYIEIAGKKLHIASSGKDNLIKEMKKLLDGDHWDYLDR